MSDVTQAGFTDWIPVEYSADVIQRINQNSAVTVYAQGVPMGTESRSTPRSGGVTLGAIDKGNNYGQDTSAQDDVWLYVTKFGGAIPIAEEDLDDSLADIVNARQVDAATDWAKLLDNACLAVTAAKSGANKFDSLYYVLSQADAGAGYTANSNISKAGTAGVTYANLSSTLGKLETSDFFSEGDVVIIAHPSFRQKLRDIVDAQGRPVFNESTAGFPGGGQGGSMSLFGYPLHFSLGARTSASATSAPTGNPLLVVANRRYMLLGNRDAFSVQAIDGRTGLGALSDTSYLKFRARKAFAVGHPKAFSVLENDKVGG